MAASVSNIGIASSANGAKNAYAAASFEAIRMAIAATKHPINMLPESPR